MGIVTDRKLSTLQWRAGRFRLVAIGWGLFNAFLTIALYRLLGPEWALANVAYLVTFHGMTYQKHRGLPKAEGGSLDRSGQSRPDSNQ